MSEVKGAAMELGTERIRKLLVQYAVPAIIAMTASLAVQHGGQHLYRARRWGAGPFRGWALTFPGD